MAIINLHDYIIGEDLGGKFYDKNNELGNGMNAEVPNPTSLDVLALGDATPIFTYCVPAETDPTNIEDCQDCQDFSVNLCTCDAEVLWVSLQDYDDANNNIPFTMKVRAKCSANSPQWNASDVSVWSTIANLWEDGPFLTDVAITDVSTYNPTTQVIDNTFAFAGNQNCNNWTSLQLSGVMIESQSGTFGVDCLGITAGLGRGGFTNSTDNSFVTRCGTGNNYVVDLNNLGYTTDINVVTSISPDPDCVTSKIEAYLIPALEISNTRWRLIAVPSCVATNDIEWRFDTSDINISTKPFSDYDLQDLDNNGSFDSSFSNTWYFEIRSKSDNAVTTGIFEVTF